MGNNSSSIATTPYEMIRGSHTIHARARQWYVGVHQHEIQGGNNYRLGSSLPVPSVGRSVAIVWNVSQIDVETSGKHLLDRLRLRWKVTVALAVAVAVAVSIVISSKQRRSVPLGVRVGLV